MRREDSKSAKEARRKEKNNWDNVILDCAQLSGFFLRVSFAFFPFSRRTAF
jgi:hypothetical protein